MGGRSSRPNKSSATTPPVMTHLKARCEVYPRTTDVRRFPVPDDKVLWDEKFPEYKPVDYTAPSVEKGPEWADHDYRKDCKK